MGKFIIALPSVSTNDVAISEDADRNEIQQSILGKRLKNDDPIKLLDEAAYSENIEDNEKADIQQKIKVNIPKISLS